MLDVVHQTASALRSAGLLVPGVRPARCAGSRPGGGRAERPRVPRPQPEPVQVDVAGAAASAIRTTRTYYYASISFVDEWIGRILATLDATGQRDTTMIVFTADHGDSLVTTGRTESARPVVVGAARVDRCPRPRRERHLRDLRRPSEVRLQRGGRPRVRVAHGRRGDGPAARRRPVVRAREPAGGGATRAAGP